MRRLLLCLLLLQLCNNSYTQSLDTVQRHIDSLNRSVQAIEDSLYRQRMLRNVQENGQTLDRFLADFREKQEKEKRANYIKIGIGAVFLTALIYGVLRKRRLQQKR